MAEATPAPTGNILQTAWAYRQIAVNKDNAHYSMALRFERRHKALGVPVVVMSALVSTAIFGSLQQNAAIGWKIATGLLSLAAATLAALQTFFNYADVAQKHRASARAWSSIRRRLEYFVLRYQLAGLDEFRTTALDELESISTVMSEAEAGEPPILEKVYEKIKQKYNTSRS